MTESKNNGAAVQTATTASASNMKLQEQVRTPNLHAREAHSTSSSTSPSCAATPADASRSAAACAPVQGLVRQEWGELGAEVHLRQFLRRLRRVQLAASDGATAQAVDPIRVTEPAGCTCTQLEARRAWRQGQRQSQGQRPRQGPRRQEEVVGGLRGDVHRLRAGRGRREPLPPLQGLAQGLNPNRGG